MTTLQSLGFMLVILQRHVKKIETCKNIIPSPPPQYLVFL